MHVDAPRPPRCVGALLRKARTWPPRSSPAPSEAAYLARSARWEPREWNRAHIVACCMLLLLLLDGYAAPAMAQPLADEVRSGTLLLKSDDGVLASAPRVHTAVRMEVNGIVARVEVRQEFHNPSEAWAEGIYAFPLPENAAVDRLRMQVGERLIVGEIREKAQAQQLYERARASGQRASVVHQNRPNLFRTAVANIGPRETITIIIGYLQIVEQDAGRYSLRFPLTITPRYVPGPDPEAPLDGETPAASAGLAAGADDSSTLADLHPALAHADPARQSVRLEIDLDAGAPLSNVFSAYHAVQTELQGARARITFANGNVAPDRDFELTWTPLIHGEPAAALFRERTANGEHVLLMLMPPQAGAPQTTPREVIFVIDTSGSMAGQSIEQARAALLRGLDTLSPADRFTVIQFNSVHESLFEQPVAATHEHVAVARRYVRRLRADGGTEMLPALAEALSMRHSTEHLRQVLFITDGAVGNEDSLMRLIEARLGNARLFTVGIGSAPNGHFMRKAAQAGRGTFTFIGSTNEVDQRMSALIDKLTRPVLTDIALDWPQGLVAEYSGNSAAAGLIGDLYAGEPIVLSARLQKTPRGILGISGLSSGAWTRQLSLDGIEPREGIASLWARKRIEALMDTRAGGASDETIRSQVLPLALEYQLVSSYTSLVAIDRTPARSDGEALRTRRIENTKPHGLDWPASGYPATATAAGLHLVIGALALILALLLTYATQRRVA